MTLNTLLWLLQAVLNIGLVVFNVYSIRRFAMISRQFDLWRQTFMPELLRKAGEDERTLQPTDIDITSFGEKGS